MANRSAALALIGALAACDSAWCVEQAVEPARAAIHAAEERYGSTDIALVEPLAALANALSAAGQPAAAIESLNRAVGILRRNAGLYDHRQYALLSQLIDLHSLLGDINAAAAALGYMERVSERTHGRHSAEHARSLSQIAAWQCRLGRFDSGRERSERSERYVEVELTVRSDGRVDNDVVIAREPGKSAADEILQALQVARFRPRVVDGATLDTEGVRFRQAFK